MNSPFLLPAGEELEARRAHHSFRDPLGDFVSYLQMYEAFTRTGNRARFCESSYLDLRTMNEIVNIKGQLEEIVSALGVPIGIGRAVRRLPLRGLARPDPVRLREDAARACTAA